MIAAASSSQQIKAPAGWGSRMGPGGGSSAPPAQRKPLNLTPAPAERKPLNLTTKKTSEDALEKKVEEEKTEESKTEEPKKAEEETVQAPAPAPVEAAAAAVTPVVVEEKKPVEKKVLKKKKKKDLSTFKAK